MIVYRQSAQATSRDPSWWTGTLLFRRCLVVFVVVGVHTLIGRYILLFLSFIIFFIIFDKNFCNESISPSILGKQLTKKLMDSPWTVMRVVKWEKLSSMENLNKLKVNDSWCYHSTNCTEHCANMVMMLSISVGRTRQISCDVFTWRAVQHSSQFLNWKVKFF